LRIIINDFSGHPFQVELSRELAARGHAVLHLFSQDFQTPRGDLARNADDPPTLETIGISIGKPFQKYDFLKRRGQEIAYGKLICQKIVGFEPDIFIGCNNPLDAQWYIQSFCRNRAIPFIFWLQDIYAIAIGSILRQRLSLLGVLIGTWYQEIEKRLLRHSNHVVAISDDFLPQLDTWQVKRPQVSVIENWAPKSKIKILPRDNEWSRKHDLSDKKVILYTGTIGLKHNPDLLLDIANAFRKDPTVRVVVVSEGKYAEYVKQKALAQGLENVAVLPFQPFEHYSEVLATGDVLLAMIEAGAAAYSVPSKVLSYLCAAKPVVLSSQPANLAARTIQYCGAGIVVNPCDHAGCIDAISGLLGDAAQRKMTGTQGRKYADEHFNISTITNKFEAIFNTIIDGKDTWTTLNGTFAENVERGSACK